MTHQTEKMRASGRARSDEKLRTISHHVGYEIDMFARTTGMLGRHILDGIEGDYLRDTVRNALLESFTVHARVLIGFLYAKPKFPDDVSALDFFTAAQWQAIKAEEPIQSVPPAVLFPQPLHKNFRSNADHPALTSASERVGKEIAHLTYKRLADGIDAKIWPHRDIVEALATDLHRFAEQVWSELVHDKFRIRAVMALMALIPAEPTAVRLEPGATPHPVATTALGPLPGA